MKFRNLLSIACLVCLLCAGAFAKDAGKSKKPVLREGSEPKIKAQLILPGDAKQGKTYPLAVFFASETFKLKADSFWREMLRKNGYPSLIIRAKNSDWRKITPRQLNAIIRTSELAKKIKIDRKKIVLIGDPNSGHILTDWIDIYPNLAGVVFISTRPLARTSDGGIAPWKPRNVSSPVPVWAIAGTKTDGAANILNMWRKFKASAPATASVTVDSRVGRSDGHISPSTDIAIWFEEIAKGKKPAPGKDYQVELEKKKFTKAADLVTKIFPTANTLATNQAIEKKAGRMTLTVDRPLGWERVESREQVYNPYGAKADENGRAITTGQTDYAEVYITPDPRKPVFARVRFRKWVGSADALMNDYIKKTTAKTGAVTIPYKRWSKNGWTYQSSAMFMLHGTKWYRWFVIIATKAGTKENPVAPVVVVMDACKELSPQGVPITREPMVKKMVAGIKTITSGLTLKYRK